MDLISRRAALAALGERPTVWTDDNDYAHGMRNQYDMDRLAIETAPSAQPTDEDIQRMQDIEQAMLEKAYWFGKQDAQQWIPCKTALPEKENTRVTYQTNAGVIIIDGIYGGIDAYGHRVWLDRERGLYWDDEVVAWMPVVIPEPWKGEQE